MASQKTINVLLGEAIVAEMKAQKIVNPPALAMRCGLDGQIVRRLLNGSSVNPTFENLASLLHGLGKTWQWLGNVIKAGYDQHGPKADRKRAAGLFEKSQAPKAKPATKAKTKPPTMPKISKPTKKVNKAKPAAKPKPATKPQATRPAPAPATAA